MNMERGRKWQASEPTFIQANKQQRIVLSLERKIQLINDSENGTHTQKDLAIKYRIGRSSVAVDPHPVLTSFTSGFTMNLPMKVETSFIRHPALSDIFIWYQEMSDKTGYTVVIIQ